VAGHSLGEYAALCAAGVLTVEETLALVVERGHLMHEAAQRLPGGMLAVNGLRPEQVEDIAHQLAPDYMVCVANYNAPTQTVLSGSLDGLRAASRWVTSLGGHGVFLNVSGAWHSPLMAEAQTRFAQALRCVEFRPPRCPVYLGATGEPVTDPARIAELMFTQLGAPVRWTQVLAELSRAGARTFVEVGPGKILRGLLRKNWSQPGDYRAFGVDGPRGLTALSPPSGAEARA
jgi:[acyl-carrier-protein] S-malonyltransferase